MSCAIFTLLGAYVLAFKKSNSWALWATFGVAIAMLVLASFLAWRDKHRELLALQERLKSPEMAFKSSSLWWGSNPNKKLAMIVAGTITNPHGPPSAAIEWQISIATKSKKEVGEIPLISKEDLKLPLEGRNERITLERSHWLPAISAAPIPSGGGVSGWLMAIFKDTTMDDLNVDGMFVTISFSDVVNEGRHSFNVPVEKTDRGITLPGTFLGQKFRDRPPPRVSNTTTDH